MIFQALKSSTTAPQNWGHGLPFKENQGRQGFITKTSFSHEWWRQLSASQEFGFAGNFESLEVSKLEVFFIFNIYILKLLKKHWKNMEFNFFASETHPWGYQWNSSPFSFLWIDKTHNSSINEQSFDLH